MPGQRRSRLAIVALLASCTAGREWNPEDEAYGTFKGTLQPPCNCTGGPPFVIQCTGGSEPDITVGVPFYETPPNLRNMTPLDIERHGLRAFGQAVGWYESTLIDDPRDVEQPAQYRWIGLDTASVTPQELCDWTHGTCEFGYQGFELENVRILCEVVP